MARAPLRKIALLSLLYFAQGLPYGFQANALPIYLRRGGRTLAEISFLSALSMPWLFKWIWAPLVDRFGSARFGRRKSWIVPLQAALALTCGAAALVTPATSTGLGALLVLVFLMNLFAATQDIAVDGMAVDLLEPAELGAGNAAQVVGYKVGMLTGGGLLVAASPWIGWSGLFGAMAALMLAAMLVALRAREPSGTSDLRATNAHPPRVPLSAVIAKLAAALRAPGSAALIVFLLTYKLGESLIETMWRPFLVDAKLSDHQIGLAIGTIGMIASIAGSLFGGWLHGRVSLRMALFVAAAGRILPMIGQCQLSLHGGAAVSTATVAAVTAAEHVFAGALTTVVFAFMMSRVDRTIGASHYTLLAAVEVLGKFPAGWISGPLAQRTGYSAVFAAGTALTAAFLFLIPLVTPPRRST